eukprot:COSAG02_NODE_1707_length_11230_cov_3.141946_6_plen_78_part_00
MTISFTVCASPLVDRTRVRIRNTSKRIVLVTLQCTRQQGRLGVAGIPASVTKLTPCLVSNNGVCVSILAWSRGSVYY